MYKIDSDRRQVTVSFDIDGFLVKNFFVEHVFPGIWRKYESGFHKAGINSENGFLEKAKELHKEKRETGNHIVAFDWDSIVSNILPRDINPVSPFLEELRASLRQEEPQLYPETKSAIGELNSIIGLNLVVLTNGLLKYQREILNKCNLLENFSSIYGPDRTGSVKPMKEAFQYISARENNYVLHAGDSEEDIRGAQTAGLDSWLVNRDCSLSQGKYLDLHREDGKVNELSDGVEPRFLSSSLEPGRKIVSRILIEANG